ncbi:MAG: PilZ domain-containing protein [Candidatus Eremiobacterota bacterium]
MEGASSAASELSMQEERRHLARRKIKVKKIFAATFQLPEGERRNCFVHLYDLHESGMRIHSDFALPPDQVIPVSLALDETLEVRVELVWQKELIGGMHVMGLKFSDLDAEQAQKIQEFLDKYSPENRRRSFRLDRILVVEMLLGTTRQRMGVFTLDLSAQGMRITHEFPLPEDVHIPFRILLEYDHDPIEVTAVVAWQKENAFGQFLVGLEFVDIDSETRMRIERFIDKAIAGEIGQASFTTLENFADGLKA